MTGFLNYRISYFVSSIQRQATNFYAAEALVKTFSEVHENEIGFRLSEEFVLIKRKRFNGLSTID